MTRTLSLSLLSSLVCALVATACGNREPELVPLTESAVERTEAVEPEAPEPQAPADVGEAGPYGRAPNTDAERAAVERAMTASKTLGRSLKRRLTEALADGPEAAVEVCAVEAQRRTAAVRQVQRVKLGRSAVKLRNPVNRGPAWVQAWLAEHGDDAPADLTPVRTVEGGWARFAAPIPMEGLCTPCHGDPETIPEGVQRVLSERYPDDEAVGFAPGELRGVIWAEARVR